MRHTRITAILIVGMVLIAWSVGLSHAEPLGTVFTYQGRLIDANSTADGLYDFQFKLYDANVVGTQKGSTISISEVDVIDGYFTVLLDFSSGVFDGNDRWLQIAVRPGDLNDPNVYTTLSPRQELTATPYAIYAKTADSISVGIDWIEIFNRPAGLDDGDQVGITSETDPVYVGSPAFGITWSNITNWNTAYGWGNHALAGYLKTEIDPTVLASVKDGITWTEVSSRPAGLDDGDQVGITSELDPQVGSNTTNYIPKWDGSALVSGTIYDNGNVGIGTTSPGNKLDVAGGGGNLTYGTDNTLTVKGNSQAIIAIDRGTTGHVGDLEFKTLGAKKWDVGMMGSDSDLRFYSWAGAGQTLFLDAVSGNVGIGTTGPQANIDISADVPRLRWTDSTTGGNDYSILADASEFLLRDETNGQYMGLFKNTEVQLMTGGTARLTIASNGNVGIGTASPIAKLEVKGNIKTEVIYETHMTKDWTPVESDSNWCSVAMSEDGIKQTAVVHGGQIYVSTDSGNTWIAKGSKRDWRSVAMSKDGTEQTAVVAVGQIYVSTNSGNTWIAKESDRGWWSVAMSADGTKQTAVVFDGQVYVSTNSGNTWIAKESDRDWSSVAMSADGTKQTAVVYGGQIYIYGSCIGVGIGTTSPVGKLDVNGSIYQRGFVLHADYVFEPGYKLESIDEHSEFMWQKKHLPAMPKIQKDENGQEIVEIGARSRGVVEELEKAHIYIEQLNKENKELRAKLTTLDVRLNAMESLVAKLSLQQEGGIK